MQTWSDAPRAAGQRIVLVPTMGALHDGHVATARARPRRHGDLVVASIFVNPMQFNVGADFDAYPRPLDDDLARCAAAGVDAVYAPTRSGDVPGRLRHAPSSRERSPTTLEGAHRPGHFRGVATVVTKLFLAVRPHVAVFGEKDFQQLAVIRRMTADLDFGIEIVARADRARADGLAMSSRNRRLSAADRAAAVCISRGLRCRARLPRGRRAFRRGPRRNAARHADRSRAASAARVRRGRRSRDRCAPSPRRPTRSSSSPRGSATSA